MFGHDCPRVCTGTELRGQSRGSNTDTRLLMFSLNCKERPGCVKNGHCDILEQFPQLLCFTKQS